MIYGGGGTIFVVVLIIIISVAASGGSESATHEFKGSEVLDEHPLILGQNKLPYKMYEVGKNLLANIKFDTDLTKVEEWKTVQTDLPRMRTGKVGGQFWTASVSCTAQYKDATELTLQQIDLIKRFIERYPNDLEFVTTSSGFTDAFHKNKIGSIIGLDGGHSIDSRMAALRIYYEMGVRYMTLTGGCQNPWADVAVINQETKLMTQTDGLTDWGKKLIWEMNRLGMIIDVSQLSEKAMNDVLETSDAPVIISQGAVFAVNDQQTLNIKNDMLEKLKKNDGIIMISFDPKLIGLSESVNNVTSHLNHVRSLIGDSHVGIGAGFDGFAETIEGLEDISTLPDLFDLLGKSSWDRASLTKLASENLVRVFKAVEATRDKMKNEEPYEIGIPDADTFKVDSLTCRTDLQWYEVTTEAPTTEAPTTEAPTTEAPTTEAPTTEAPAPEVPDTGDNTDDKQPEVPGGEVVKSNS